MSATVTRVVLATRNQHKVVELRHILSDVVEELGLEIVGASEFEGAPDVVEDEVTFEGNARLKAVALARHTGLPALADDSGLAVDVLGGAPGIFSARWAGRHGDDLANLQLLLDQLADVKDEHRAAGFVCAAVLALPDGTLRSAEGHFRGTLAREPRGANGFGYDPLLVVEGDTRTAAELSPEEKNAISHRGKAFRAMVPHLRELLG
ncbi:RdgB/HAM1 family non-canonical purine NTP pyrophosphatase [Phycicoccus sp. M110.8]|uniref:RdgB/HAM1 family non-canonical purine NTP pyrophosphatase n=1 Tax=Phycicoccus sp. M110.8 TaxID=3075433 RepID=UPI0028FD945B|nr:RdgB/HAM1 family non-canonical purine NTP pyrophosphatase [Phycicoccus sp. M110.8]MDU0312493.1 RdgB/HAM1 family non-canonical purine NTP pyrophosphatase [Phycicoccus sp. M110.8]